MGGKEELGKTGSGDVNGIATKLHWCSLQYALLLVALAAQVATLIITRELWEVRADGMPHLPVFAGVSQISFFWILLATLAAVPFFPRSGVWLHLGLMLVACLFDQMRTQPQFLAIWILMAGVTHGATGVGLTRWFLASLWFWAGLHKLLSPSWNTIHAWEMANALGLNADQFYYSVAILVGLSEMGVGLLAWFKPKFGAVGCILLHCGIVVYLSPLFLNWNFSVIPWNLATAIIGAWILFKAGGLSQKSRIPVNSDNRLPWWQAVWFQRVFFAVLLIVPSGFYLGWMDHGYSHVLYSDHLPRGLVTHDDGTVEKVSAWGVLAAPFPNERRLLRQYFFIVAEVGEKFHVRDPRAFLNDIHLEMTVDGPRDITREEFFSGQGDIVRGVEIDSRKAVFELVLAGARVLKRDKDSMVYAIEFNPKLFHSDLLKELGGISNIEQIQLAGTSVTDEDLKQLVDLPKLAGIGLNNTSITDQGIETLMKLPQLMLIEVDGTRVTPQTIGRFYESRSLTSE